MGKILLFYKYVAIQYPSRSVKWQKKLATELGLKGRILIGQEGINGTVGGTDENIERYKIAMRKDPLFADIDFKESDGGADCFPKLRVATRSEIVGLGINPADADLANTGTHLKPDEVHELLNNKPEDLLIFDARNDHEWQVGRFTDAINPGIEHFRNLPEYFDANLDLFKDKKVLMYCTGGVRCERGSAYLKTKGIAKEVYQVEGGIHNYVEKYPEGHFRGKNYVFDGRITVKVNDDVLSTCALCTQPCDDFINCLNALCNKHIICCTACKEQYKNSCGAECMKLLEEKAVAQRPDFKKFESSEPVKAHND